MEGLNEQLVDWLGPMLVPLLSALLGGGLVKVIADHWYQRQQAQVAKAAEGRAARTVEIEAEKVILTDRETDIHEAAELRLQFTEAMRFIDTVVRNLDSEVKRLALMVQACHERERVRDELVHNLRARVVELEARA